MVDLLLRGKSVILESTVPTAKKLKEEIQSRFDIPVSCQLLSSAGNQLSDEAALPGEPVLVTNFWPLHKKKTITEISKTEERGITLKQLQELLAFLEAQSKDWPVMFGM